MFVLKLSVIQNFCNDISFIDHCNKIGNRCGIKKTSLLLNVDIFFSLHPYLNK